MERWQGSSGEGVKSLDDQPDYREIQAWVPEGGRLQIMGRHLTKLSIGKQRKPPERDEF